MMRFYFLLVCFGIGEVLQLVLMMGEDIKDEYGDLATAGICSLVLGHLPLELFSSGLGSYVQNLPFHLYGSVLIFLVFGAGSFLKNIAPLVDEHELLGHTLTLWYAFLSLYFRPSPAYYAVAVLLAFPSLSVLWLAFSAKPVIGVAGKVFFYSWYLFISVGILVSQCMFGYFKMIFGDNGGDPGALGAMTFGMGLIYMLACWYSFAMLTSYLITPVDPTGKRDEETMRRLRARVSVIGGPYSGGRGALARRSAVILVLFGGFLVLNKRFSMVSVPMVLNIGLVLPVMLRSGPRAVRVLSAAEAGTA